MRQTELLATVMRLPEGQSIAIRAEDIIEAVEGSLRSALDGPVRDSDIKEFKENIECNWGVEVSENIAHGGWIISK